MNKNMRVNSCPINSDNQDDWTDVEARLSRNEIDILLISPERLANERFRSHVLSSISERISLLVIDEAHCISDWGHDFRPHYRLLERIVRTLPSNLRLLATTATANNRVMEDIAGVLGPNLEVSRGDLNRPSLTLQTIRSGSGFCDSLPNARLGRCVLPASRPRRQGTGFCLWNSIEW